MKLTGWVCRVISFSMVCLNAQTVVYETGFERFEGFAEEQDLWGQNGWTGFGSGGNGLVTEFFEGAGQQAYIGSAPPEQGDEYLVLLNPVNFTPVAGAKSIVRFSVVMEIVDSTNEQYDEFRWSVYNLNGDRLFCIVYDNFDFSISYQLEGSQTFIKTQYQFQHGDVYDFEIVMDVDKNQWRAFMNGLEIITAQPITNSEEVEISLGDIDAIWFFYDLENPGDNFMLFDDYRITVEEAVPIIASIRIAEHRNDGSKLLEVLGEPGGQYDIKVSEDLEIWDTIDTDTASANEGTFSFIDQAAIGKSKRFYLVKESL